jgi:hypothetical protein
MEKFGRIPVDLDRIGESERREKMVISIEETPEEFIAAMQSQYYDADQAALDRLME